MTPDSALDTVADHQKQPSAPSTAGMTTKVVKGSIWTLAGQVAPLAVSLVATPFTIRLLGAEGYGVLILIGLIPTYFGFADLGMSIASTKFASEAYAAGDPDKEARTVRTAAVIALCASIPIATLIFLLSGWLVTLFKVPEHLAWEASAALRVASVTFVLNFLSQIFNTPQLTRLRMDLNTFVTSGFRMLGIAATPIVIYLGGGILGAILVLLAAAVLTLAGHIYTSGRLLPPLFDIFLDRTVIRPLLKFGGGLAAASIAGVVLGNLEKILLAKAASVETLAYYSVAFTLASMMTLFSVAMAQSLIPAFSQLQGDEKRSILSGLYSRGITMNVIWLIPVLIILATFAKPLFTLWAGEAFGRESVRPFYILLLGIGLYVAATPARAALMASGRSDIMAKVGWIELFPYVGLVWLLTHRFGATGAAAAWGLRASIDAIVSFIFAKRVSGIVFVRRHLGSFALALFVMLGPLVATFWMRESYLILSLTSVVCGLAYAFVVWTRLLGHDEIAWLRSKLTSLRPIL